MKDLDYVITTTKGVNTFSGKYRKDLETDNWHCYEKRNGIIMHFRKEHMISVEGDTVESIKTAKCE